MEKSISRYPEYQSLEAFYKDKRLEALPAYNPRSLRESIIDLRSRDISHLNLKDRLQDLLHCSFDNKTKWPKELPEAFNPGEILNMNKTPGLNVRSLHESGITGEGIGIAAIDYALIVDHEEYRDNVMLYDEVHYLSKQAHFHGPSIASILVGKNAGIAPKADLYFIGCENYDVKNGVLAPNFSYFADSIYKIMEKNKSLPDDRKIRVISISAGWNPKDKGYEEITRAIDEATKQGIFVVSGNMFEQNPAFYFHGLDRDPLKNPDDAASYTTYSSDIWLEMVGHMDGFKDFYLSHYRNDKQKKLLLIPMASRTVATAGGDSDYALIRIGGWSSAIPYISGLYALSCQVDPNITPEKFWEAAYKTGTMQSVEIDGKNETAAFINPVKLIESIKIK